MSFGAAKAPPAVNGISLDVRAGEMVALVGESGSGKSVTALAILRLLPRATANVRAGGLWFSPDGISRTDLTTMDAEALRQLRGNRIGIIFQEPMTSLNPVMTCGRQVMESIREHRKLSKTEAELETIHWFEKVQLPSPERMLRRYPHELSGGQKQRVMIAMAICNRPSLLICDEPTTALDVTVQRAIVDLLRNLSRSEQMGMLFITHDLGLVGDMADRAAVMYRGNIVETGDVPALFAAPGHPYTKGLLQCRPLFHRKGERLPQVSDFWDGHAVSAADGISPRVDSPPDPTIISGPAAEIRTTGLDRAVLLEAEHLTIQYNGINAVADAGFCVYRGETLGLVGESGCGKTTLGRALLRLKDPSSGSLRYEGRDLLQMPGAELRRFRRKLQIVFQDPYSALNPRITVGSAITEAIGNGFPETSRSERKSRMEEMLEKVGLLPEHAARYPFAFSGGQRQRIVIARALALRPEFVLFDESVSALDVSVQAQVLNLINALKKDLGFTAVFISHDLSVIRYLCDRVMVMERGRIVETGDAESVYLRPQTDYTRRLVEAIPGRQQTPV